QIQQPANVRDACVASLHPADAAPGVRIAARAIGEIELAAVEVDVDVAVSRTGVYIESSRGRRNAGDGRRVEHRAQELAVLALVPDHGIRCHVEDLSDIDDAKGVTADRRR